MAHPSVDTLLQKDPAAQAHLVSCADCRRMVALLSSSAGASAGAALERVPLVERKSYSGWQELPDARGGMGKLFRAFDERLGREVAVKQVRAPGDADANFHEALLGRLEREARLTARLQHPGIVVVYEVGRFEDGELFYAMPLVRGRPLSREIEARKTVAERLALLPQLTNVAEAIAYSHEKGVLHRDIKPDNVLVGEFGEAVVIDWGLAKDVAGAGRDDLAASNAALPADAWRASADGLTQMGVGTPQYMAPEQGRGEEPTPAVDVYALGATLYHLLAGEPPYGLRSSREVRHALQAGPPRPLGELAPDVPAELAALCNKAMARAPAERHASARELADELRRFQTGSLLRSHRYSPGELLRHYLHKHRTSLSVGAAALVLLVAITIAGVVNVERQRRRAEQHRAQAEQHRLEAEHALRRAQGVLASRLAAEAPRRLEAIALAVRAVGPELTGEVAGAPAAEALQGLYDALAAGPVPLPLGHPGAITNFAISPDGKTFAGAGDDKSVLLWDAHTGRKLSAFTSQLKVPHQIRFAPDGKRFALSGPAPDAEIFELASGRRVAIATQGAVGGGAWTPQGEFVVATGELAWHDPISGEARRRFKLPARANGLAASPRGHVAVAGLDGSLLIFPPGGGEPSRLLESGASPTSLAFDAAGRRLALVRRDGSALLADLDEPAARPRALFSDQLGQYASRVRFGAAGLVAVPLWSEEEVETLAFDAASGARLSEAAVFAQEWTASDDAAREPRYFADARGEQRLVDARDGRAALVLAGHVDEVKAAAALPDAVASASREGAEYLWDLRPGRATGLLIGHTGEVIAALPDARGERLLTAGLDGSVRLWSLADGRQLWSSRASSAAAAIDWSPDGKRALAGFVDGSVRMLDAQTGAAQELWKSSGPISAVHFFAGGRRAIFGSLDGELALLEPGFPLVRMLHVRAGKLGAVLDAAVSADGSGALSAHADGTARLWELRTGSLAGTLEDSEGGEEPGDHDAPASVLFAGDTALVSRASGSTFVRAGSDLHELRKLAGRAAGPRALSPDGTRFAAAATDGLVWVHELATGRAIPLGAKGAVVLATAFSSDGKLLAAGGIDGSVRVFEIDSGRVRIEVNARLGPTTAIALTNDGRWVVAGHASGALRMHAATPDAALERACGVLRRFAREADAADYCATFAGAAAPRSR